MYKSCVVMSLKLTKSIKTYKKRGGTLKPTEVNAKSMDFPSFSCS